MRKAGCAVVRILTKSASGVENSSGGLVNAQQCPEFSLDVPLAQEHHTQQPIEEPSEENALANHVADDIFDWIVFHWY